MAGPLAHAGIGGNAEPGGSSHPAGPVPAARPQMVLMVMGLYSFFLIKGTCLPRGKVLGLNYDFPYANGLNKGLPGVLSLLPPLPPSRDKPTRTLLRTDRDPRAALFIPGSRFK